MVRRLPLILTAVLPLAVAAQPVLTTLVDGQSDQMAQATTETGWATEKCRRYRIAWTQLAQRRGRTGLSEQFLASHDAFMARNCEDPRDVCPRSAAELDVANAMTMAAMNAGTASTFLPFACRAPRG
jgi:hypothetical protein